MVFLLLFSSLSQKTQVHLCETQKNAGKCQQNVTTADTKDSSILSISFEEEAELNSVTRMDSQYW